MCRANASYHQVSKRYINNNNAYFCNFMFSQSAVCVYSILSLKLRSKQIKENGELTGALQLSQYRFDKFIHFRE